MGGRSGGGSEGLPLAIGALLDGIPEQVSAPGLRAGIDGFAAGALLVMLVDSMIPEANTKAKDWAGLATVLGFASATGLSTLS